MDLTQLFLKMQQGALVITPNKRLATELTQQFFTHNFQTVQEKPNCWPYEIFLQYLFKTYCDHHPLESPPLLLTSAQLSHLWQIILTSQGEKLCHDGLIQEAEEAWRRCERWQLDFNHPSFAHTTQTQQLRIWVSQLQEVLQNLNALTSENLVSYLLAKLLSIPPTVIIWHCFDDYTPQQHALQNHLEKAGCTILHSDLPIKLENAFVYAAENGDEEQTVLLGWIKERLAEGDKRIGVIVPELSSKASGLERLFEQRFPDAFNISLGKSLADFPLVAHALCFLSLDGAQLTNHHARLLLSSPYLEFAKNEMLKRAQALHDCGALQEAIIPFPFFLQALKPYAPKLASLLENLPRYPEKAPLQDWATWFKQRLQQLKFPGDYSLHSENYQCYTRFLNLLEEFKELSFITPQMRFAHAFATLMRLAKKTIFQPQSVRAPIQILGLLEASGCTFDSVWVMGTTADYFPQRVKLSAFIPVSLQKEYFFPHADAARELLLAEKTIARLKNSSTTAIFSFPHLSQDKPNLQSPLTLHFPLFKSSPFLFSRPTARLEVYREAYTLPLQSHEKQEGGTALLANQAKCPFRAFATHRLHIKSPVALSDGLNALERGKIIHKVMEIIWQTLKTQEALLKSNGSELAALIKKALQIALAPYQKERPYSFSDLITHMEELRLTALVQACLDWEKTRPPFEVTALEEEFTYELSSFSFKVRVDRLDKVGEKKWVIDYKNTPPLYLPWKEDRPIEPQLLLYALLDDTINTLLFVGLKEREVTLKGLSEEIIDFQGISTLKKNEEWSQNSKDWEGKLITLIKEYQAGHCLPKPVRATVCQQCPYPSICRLPLVE